MRLIRAIRALWLPFAAVALLCLLFFMVCECQDMDNSCMWGCTVPAGMWGGWVKYRLACDGGLWLQRKDCCTLVPAVTFRADTW